MIKENELSIMDTTIAKGIAIVLMLIHHLFAFPDRLQIDILSQGII